MGIFFLFAALIVLGEKSSYAQKIDFFENFENKPHQRWTQNVVLGDLKLDTFSFSAKQYIPITPIDHSSAFFDVYNGGKRGFSNGNGMVEKTELISPYVTSTFTASVFLTFDYQFIKLRSAIISAHITSDSGKTWNRIWTDSVGNSHSQNVTLQVDKIINPKGAIRLKFEWQTTDTFLNQGYGFFDNVMLYSKKNDDVGISSNLKVLKGCSGSFVDLKFNVQNWGNVLKDTVIVETKIIRQLNSIALQRDTFWSLKPNQIQSVYIKKYQLSNPGLIKVMARILTADALQFNDTASVLIQIGDSIKPANSANQIRCGIGTLTFRASSDGQDSILWLSKKGIVLGSGKYWTTPEILKTDTFLAHASVYQADSISTFQGPYRFNTAATGGSYLQVAAKNKLVVNGYSQHFASDQEKVEALIYFRKGSLAGNELDSSTWTLWHKTTITTKGWGKYSDVKIPPIYLNASDTISLYIAFIGRASFTFKKGEIKVENEALSLTASSVNDKLFSKGGMLYKSYSWDGRIFYDQICLSPAKEVYAIISPKPLNASITASAQFSGVIKDGKADSPDEIGIQFPASYQISPPKGKKSSDYGTSWRLESIEVKLLNGQVITNGITSTVSSDKTNPPKVTISADSLWIDSILTLSMKLIDSGFNCDTLLTRSFRFSRPPGSKFSHDAACLSTPTAFVNQTNKISGAKFRWSFDDGGFDTATHPAHIFLKNRVYNVQLVGFNKFGVSDTFNQAITALLYPKASIRAVHTCVGAPAELQNISTNASLTNSIYTWIYQGDTIHRSDDVKPFSYVFDSPGIHSVTLVANHFGCIDSIKKNVFQFENPKAAFDFEGNCQFDTFNIINKSSIGGGEKLGFRWLLNNVNVSTNENPTGILTQSGLLKIALHVTSEFNCSDTLIKQISILPGVKAKFGVDLACKNDSTVFHDLSLNPSSIPVSYLWNLGDGNNSTKSDPKHFYNEVGEKKVRLAMVADNGCTSYADTSVVVRVHPIARFNVSDICAGQEAIFLNQTKLENRILFYQWFFGDGDSSSLHSPKHAYDVDENATYLVRLKVFTKDGLCSDEFNNTINVLQNPSCDFRFEPLPNDSLTVQFFPLDSTLTEFTWAIDGGGNSTVANPIHTFPEKKIYGVRLFAKDQNKCWCNKLEEVKIGFVSNQEFDHNSVKIYPNPFFETIYLDNSENTITNVQVHDLMGRRLSIYSNASNSSSIEVKFTYPPPNFVVITIQTEKAEIRKILAHH